MANNYTWSIFGYGEGEKRVYDWVAITDRSTKGHPMTLNVNDHAATLQCKALWAGYKWAPTLLIPINDRVTPDDAKKLGQVICDALNANWVKEKLEEA